MPKVAKNSRGERRGSKPGERRGGRKKGTPNRSTAEVRRPIVELCRAYAPAAVHELARLAREASSETARIAACNAILDRAYGKAPQPMADANGDAVTPQVLAFTWLPPSG
jgi:hypothetical protein